MDKFNSTILNEVVTPEWLSKTYSEYMYACADDLAEINNEIADKSDDAELDAIIDQYMDDFEACFKIILEDIKRQGIAAGLTYEDINTKSSNFISWFSLSYSPSSEATQAITDLGDTFPNSLDGTIANFKTLYLQGISSDNLVMSTDDFANRLQTIASGISTSMNLSGTYMFPLQDGYVSFQDLVKTIVSRSALGSDDDITLSISDSQGDSIGSATYKVDELIEEMKEGVSSAIAWAQGFASAAISNISDRINNFTESIKTSFQNSYTETKKAFNNVRAILAQTNMDVRTFINTAQDMLGIKQLAESNAVPSETDVSMYTGTSPYAGMDLHTAKGVTGVVGRTCAALVYGAWSAIKSIGTRIWHKVKPILKNFTYNPSDYKLLDKDATSYQVEDWCYMGEGKRQVIFWNAPYAYKDDWWEKIRFDTSKINGKTFAFDTYFGSLVITYDNGPTSKWMYTVNTSTDEAMYGGNFSYKFKPKALKLQTLYDAGLIFDDDDLPDANKVVIKYIGERYPGDDYPHFANVTEYVEALRSAINSGELYEDSEDEVAISNGFRVSVNMMFTILHHTLEQVRAQLAAGPEHLSFKANKLRMDAEYNYYNIEDESINWWHPIVRTFVNNKFALMDTSGYEQNDPFSPSRPGSYPFNNFGVVHNMMGYFDATEIAALFNEIIILQLVDRKNRPGDYWFVPYTSDTFEFAEPRFRIKTDIENQNIADVFASTLLMVTVVAIAVIVGAKICRTIKKAKFKKWTTIKGRMDNAIWQGETLTRQEWRKYLRADKKLSKLNLWSVGTATSNVIEPSNVTSSFFGSQGASSIDNSPAPVNLNGLRVILTGR